MYESAGVSNDTCSSSFASSRHGPHHVAKKSITSGLSRFCIATSSSSAVTCSTCQDITDRLGFTHEFEGTLCRISLLL